MMSSSGNRPCSNGSKQGTRSASPTRDSSCMLAEKGMNEIAAKTPEKINM